MESNSMVLYMRSIAPSEFGRPNFEVVPPSFVYTPMIVKMPQRNLYLPFFLYIASTIHYVHLDYNFSCSLFVSLACGSFMLQLYSFLLAILICWENIISCIHLFVSVVLFMVACWNVLVGVFSRCLLSTFCSLPLGGDVDDSRFGGDGVDWWWLFVSVLHVFRCTWCCFRIVLMLWKSVRKGSVVLKF